MNLSPDSPVQAPADPLAAMMEAVVEESYDAPAYDAEEPGADEEGYDDESSDEEYADDGEEYVEGATDEEIDEAYGQVENDVDTLLSQIKQSQTDNRELEKFGQQKSQAAAASDRRIAELEGELDNRDGQLSEVLQRMARLEGMAMGEGADLGGLEEEDHYAQYADDPVVMGLVEENEQFREWQEGVDTELGATRTARESQVLLDNIQTQADVWIEELYGDKPDPGTREYDLLSTALNEWVVGAGLDPNHGPDPARIQNAYNLIFGALRRVTMLDGYDLEDRADEADLVGEDTTGSTYAGSEGYDEDHREGLPEVPDMDGLSEPESEIALADYLLQYAQASAPG